MMENAAEETKEITEEEVSTETEEETTETDAEGSEDGAEEEEELPPWMAKSEEAEDNKKVPLASLVEERKKYQGRVSERDEKIDKLESKLQNLESSIQTSSDSQSLKRPKDSDFDTTEEYDIAVDEWHEQRINAKFDSYQQTNTQQVQQDKVQREMTEGLNAHNARAETLLKDNPSMSADVYLAAEDKVKQAIFDVLPQGSDATFNLILSALGEGSEKVLPYLGRNTAKLEKFQSLLAMDRTGTKALIFLGEQKQLVNNGTKKQTSQARKPAATVVGDKVSSLKGKAEQKKFEAAKTGQEAYNIRKAFKAAGGDVSEWR